LSGLSLPLPEQAAFLLDVDGTLLDFAPRPMEVMIPPGLLEVLVRLKQRVGGALGMVSGRPVEQVVRLFGDVPQAIAGEHGGAIRYAPGAAVERVRASDVPAGWLVKAERLALQHPGALLEQKAHGFVLHYRNAPDAGPALQAGLEGVVGGSDAFQLVSARMAWEVRPRGADKGSAARALMTRAPFVGRKPVFVGDDVTDEDGVRAARAMGGVGLMVADAFGDPAGVRAWLGRLAAEGW
jgi:trehalose 6-phosphate phosphatase